MSAPAPAAGRTFLPHLLLLAMIAIWGGSYAAVKGAQQQLSPFALVAVRFWLSVPLLLPFVLRDRPFANLRTSALPGITTGIVLAAGYLLQTLGMTGTSTSMAGFLAGSIPLLVGIGGWSMFAVRLGTRSWIGLGLGGIGLLLLVWPTAGPGAGTPDTLRGIGLQIGSSVCYAGHVLMISRLGRNCPAMAYCLWQLLVVALLATLALALDGRWGPDGDTAPQWTTTLWLQLAYMSLLATALGIAVQSLAQPKIPPMHVALLFASQPLFAAVGGLCLMGDSMGAAQWAGGALVVAGIVVTACDRRV